MFNHCGQACSSVTVSLACLSAFSASSRYSLWQSWSTPAKVAVEWRRASTEASGKLRPMAARMSRRLREAPRGVKQCGAACDVGPLVSMTTVLAIHTLLLSRPSTIEKRCSKVVSVHPLQCNCSGENYRAHINFRSLVAHPHIVFPNT